MCVLVQLLMELIRNKVCIIYDIHFILYQLLLSIRIMIILLDERSSAGFSCVMSDCLCGTDWQLLRASLLLFSLSKCITYQLSSDRAGGSRAHLKKCIFGITFDWAVLAYCNLIHMEYNSNPELYWSYSWFFKVKFGMQVGPVKILLFFTSDKGNLDEMRHEICSQHHLNHIEPNTE